MRNRPDPSIPLLSEIAEDHLPAGTTTFRDAEQIYHLVPNGDQKWLLHVAATPIATVDRTDNGYRGVPLNGTTHPRSHDLRYVLEALIY